MPADYHGRAHDPADRFCNTFYDIGIGACDGPECRVAFLLQDDGVGEAAWSLKDGGPAARSAEDRDTLRTAHVSVHFGADAARAAEHDKIRACGPDAKDRRPGSLFTGVKKGLVTREVFSRRGEMF
jgi:hypothetical protein